MLHGKHSIKSMPVPKVPEDELYLRLGVPDNAHNPLTSKGRKIMASMKSQYGAKKGKQVFYASKNAGRIKGVEK